MENSKVKKSSFLGYIYNGRLTTVLYYIAALTFIIPTIILSVTNTPVNPYLSRSITGAAGLFFILGRILVIINKKKEKMNISVDVGIIVGITIGIISSIISL